MWAIAPCSGLIAAVAAKMQSAALEHVLGDGWSGQSVQWDVPEADATPTEIEQESDRPPVARSTKTIAAAKARPSRSFWMRRMRSRIMRTRVTLFSRTSKLRAGSIASDLSVQTVGTRGDHEPPYRSDRCPDAHSNAGGSVFMTAL